MHKWKKFELECTDYLNKTYGSFFSHLGFSDSTISDIKYEKNGNSFFIEAKMPSAQAGQFVLLPDLEKEKFIFSPANKSNIDENAKLIIEHMNNDFTNYKNAGTRGKSIELPQNIFYNWIINTYKAKDVEFLITKKENFIIFPIEKLQNYFEVTCTYRIKRSGSLKLPKSMHSNAIEHLKKLEKRFTVIENSQELMIESKEELDRFTFFIGNTKCMLARVGENTYRFSKLSSTCNANVIFTINLFAEQNSSDLEFFKSRL